MTALLFGTTERRRLGKTQTGASTRQWRTPIQYVGIAFHFIQFDLLLLSLIIFEDLETFSDIWKKRKNTFSFDGCRVEAPGSRCWILMEPRGCRILERCDGFLWLRMKRHYPLDSWMSLGGLHRASMLLMMTAWLSFKELEKQLIVVSVVDFYFKGSGGGGPGSIGEVRAPGGGKALVTCLM